jgi:uncharacterized protein (TIGR00369 family)
MTAIPYTDTVEERSKLNLAFFGAVPHNISLGIEVRSLGRDSAELVLPFAPFLIGDPERQLIHGGPITALVDAACGAAVFQALPSPAPIATLDLRVDHLRAALAGHDIVAQATCYRVTPDVAFVRCTATQTDQASRVIAETTACFMVGTARGQRTLQNTHSGDGSTP